MQTAHEIETLEALQTIARELGDLDLNPTCSYGGMTTPDHLFNISYHLSELVDTMKKIEAKMK